MEENKKGSSKKKKTEIMIPDVTSMTNIKQPNRITNAKYDYTIMQQRCFLTIIKALQDTINQVVKDRTKSIQQLQLFQTPNSHIEFKVDFKDIAKKHSQYKEVWEAVMKLSTSPFTFEGIDPITGVEAIRVGGLFEAYLPLDQKKKHYFSIRISKDVAARMVMVQQGYTNFLYEIAYNAKNKYTARIYQLISRWKDKGGAIIEYAQLREMLLMGDKYSEFKEFKRNVLDVAHKELYQKSDCWFEVAGFERTEGKVSHVKFKIITVGQIKFMETKAESIKGLLKLHFGFKQEHMLKVQPLLDNVVNLGAIQIKLLDLMDVIRIKAQNGNPINNVPSYVLTSLLTQFKFEIQRGLHD
ncbi:MAG: replication initiation protein [Bacteroidetes bacterium]|nr:replication initiation protein [Bacteroidota bacterium]